MRILVLLPSLLGSIGGIQTYSQALVWSLDELGKRFGWRIHVLALLDRDGPGSAAQNGLSQVEYVGFSGDKFRFGMAAIQAARGADFVLLAHSNFAPLLHFIRWVAPHSACRVSVHGIDVWKPLGRVTRSALSWAGEVWPVSDFTRQEMVRHNPSLRALRFSYLPNTLGPSYPPAQAAKTRSELGLPPGPLLLCVSRMSAAEPYKNVEWLIRSMTAVRQQLPAATLVIVGPGDDRARLERLVAELQLSDRVRFAGRVADDLLQSYFAACDLFVLPSTGEGFGIVYLEAMYHAKACVGAAAGGVPEVIEDGVTGLLVNAEEKGQLPAAIVRLLQDDALRSAMGQAGKKRLEKEFSVESFRARLEALLRRTD